MEMPSGNLNPEAVRAIVSQVRQGLREDLTESGLAPTDRIELSPRWDGGELVLKPSRPGLQEKSVPIESFFHKIVLARERLRVLEQKINSHPKLNDGERLELQAYITRIYGSFTTFNVLFDDRADWFVGSSADR